MTPTLPPDYFARLYADDEDPWQISTGWYEQRKRALIMAGLPLERYDVAFEPGCSNGELTVQLATRCNQLIAWDINEQAIERARRRTAALPHVQIRQAALPDQWPTEQCDLIVLAEIGYYLDLADLTRAVGNALDRLKPGGTVVAVHWRHRAPDYPLTGDQVHTQIASSDRLYKLGGYVDADFLLDIWTLGPVTSVATATGVLAQ